ncbi:MAG: agmatine deiminase family protein, partial [Bacteroidales bacterium]
MKNYLLLFIFFFTSTLFVNSQQPFTNQAFQSKYHMLDSSELYSPPVKSKSFTPTSPPLVPVRSIAEFEPTEAVLVAYPGQFGIPISLIAEMSQDCKVITIVESSAQQTTVTSQYNSNGVNMSNCSFYIAPLDSYWIRDYGPWFIMINNNEVAIVDFPYNRPGRPNDDEVPVEMASYLNVNLYGMDIMHTGGNYMSDGMGIAASTDLVTDENTSLTVPQINTLVNDFLGVSNYYITTDPLADYIKHIDCWGKFLDVDKVLITSVPVTDIRYADYEAMATFWENEISSYGDNYHVFRVYEPDGQPYTNSYILNKKVFVPYVTGTGSAQNSAALAVYQQAMPGYEIFGISSSSWVSTDALHCRTHEVADRKMLYIYHMPLL